MIPLPPEVSVAALKNLDPDSTTILNRVYRGSVLIPTIPNEPLLRNSENPAISGFSNARALARIGSMVSLGGTVDGTEFLSPQTLAQVTR
ncbi:beta-lactamase [Penicillium angulare]|uniref:beta-lactamase n=1 Tax=Penicillium angulare TaxID=116970 RepID=UPI002541A418|nr:beta-lactamase [Penicillium angulare]KAJ5272592.1 beta-lactamase [Penicillium angulare]